VWSLPLVWSPPLLKALAEVDLAPTSGPGVRPASLEDSEILLGGEDQLPGGTCQSHGLDRRRRVSDLAGLLGIGLRSDADRIVIEIVGESVWSLVGSESAWDRLLCRLHIGRRRTYLPSKMSVTQIAARRNAMVWQNARENLAQFASRFLTNGIDRGTDHRAHETTARQLLRVLCELERSLDFIYGPLLYSTTASAGRSAIRSNTEPATPVGERIVEGIDVERAAPSGDDFGRSSESTLLTITEAAALVGLSRKTIYDWINDPVEGFEKCVEIVRQGRGGKRIRRDEFRRFLERRNAAGRYVRERASKRPETSPAWRSPPASDQTPRAIAIRYFGRSKPFSMAEMEERFGCSRFTISRWCPDGLKKFIKGKVTLFHVEHVHAFIMHYTV